LIVPPANAALRFVISGGLAALVAIGTYYAAAVVCGISPYLANLIAFALQFGVSYWLHRAFSFNVKAEVFGSMSRYALLSVLAFAINTGWVWLLTHALALTAWTPILPMVAVTPCITFFVARYWVFASAGKRGFIVR